MGKEGAVVPGLELRIYETGTPWDKRAGPLAELTKGKPNKFRRFEQKAQKLLGRNSPRVFVVMPIQGEKHGSQEDQRVYREYDERFVAVETVVAKFGGVAIRIDKEHPLEDLVGRIKKEIRDAAFIVADLTDERPSCYFEAGYAEALLRPVIYVASKQSVLRPGTATHIHSDIHMNVQMFTNHKELAEKLGEAIAKNRDHTSPGAQLPMANKPLQSAAWPPTAGALAAHPGHAAAERQSVEPTRGPWREFAR